MSGPVIGLTLDSEAPGGYSTQPWYALRQNYCSAIAAAGGVPVLLPHEPELAPEYLDALDGVIITGGAFDVDPLLFGAGARHASVVTKERRTRFELALTREALARDMPLLGICGGLQLLNVALGGTLIQHIPDEIAGALAHEQPNPRDQPGHVVAVLDGTRLRAIAGFSQIAVNSAHHQAVKDVAPGLLVDATAPDGVIEGVEDSQRRFCIGVQWHPEYHVSPADGAIFAALVAAAR